MPIIGGGPAGMSCALWLHNYGFRPRIVEQEGVFGGMARLSPYPNDWLLGRPGATARENAEEFVRHIRWAPAAIAGLPGRRDRDRDAISRRGMAR